MSDKKLTFWDHLDELRSSLLRMVGITVVFGLVAFFFKDLLFEIVLAPKRDDFITYRVFHSLISAISGPETSEGFSVDLINTGLAEQFLIHMKVAFSAGFICASPYIIYALFRFVSPALYDKEKKYATRVVFSGYAMFLIGVALNYFLIFPLTFRFLGTYQVSPDVENLISLRSYIGTFTTLSIVMGVVFEMPIVAWLFAKLGFITSAFLKKYRRHAIVIILAVAAVITPTADVFTLMLVAIPMIALYEVSVWICATQPSSKQQLND